MFNYVSNTGYVCRLFLELIAQKKQRMKEKGSAFIYNKVQNLFL